MQHTNWDKWISENIRYALSNNTAGDSLPLTYSEYYVGGYMGRWGSIDIVGKNALASALDEDVVVEIKGSASDVNSGKGQNFVGRFNFFATDRDFCPALVKYRDRHYPDSGIGVLVVEPDGRTTTVVPAADKDGNEYRVESSFDGFATDDDVEDYFASKELPKQKYMDSHKPYYRSRQAADGSV